AARSSSTTYSLARRLGGRDVPQLDRLFQPRWRSVGKKLFDGLDAGAGEAPGPALPRRLQPVAAHGGSLCRAACSADGAAADSAREARELEEREVKINAFHVLLAELCP